MNEYCVIFCTVSSKEEGRKIAEKLLQEKLAPCLNIVDGITSLYTWKGEVCDEPEFLCIIKTRKSLFEKVREAIISVHSYEVPEVIQLPIEAGHAPYLQWISDNTKER
ncbi:MAG: divalent-cation tolerance protein CutA [bacterium]|nr:divalent-cation tolerance protein CutA [bacterium]